jgi:putative transcriptional regulator
MDLNIDFFHIKNTKVAEGGRVLVSEPFLADTYFRRSVVYLTEHNNQGSMGFVLNKALDIKVGDVIDDFPEGDFPVSVGGPVSTNTVHYLHTLGDAVPDSVHVKDGIFWGGDFEALKEQIRIGGAQPSDVRFFLGYSGWTENQLQGELDMHAWLIGEIPAHMVMKGFGADFWVTVLSRFEAKYKAWANFPQDPGLN